MANTLFSVTITRTIITATVIFYKGNQSLWTQHKNDPTTSPSIASFCGFSCKDQPIAFDSGTLPDICPLSRISKGKSVCRYRVGRIVVVSVFGQWASSGCVGGTRPFVERHHLRHANLFSRPARVSHKPAALAFALSRNKRSGHQRPSWSSLGICGQTIRIGCTILVRSAELIINAHNVT